jgi:hypothetical protein
LVLQVSQGALRSRSAVVCNCHRTLQQLVVFVAAVKLKMRNRQALPQQLHLVGNNLSPEHVQRLLLGSSLCRIIMIT